VSENAVRPFDAFQRRDRDNQDCRLSLGMSLGSPHKVPIAILGRLSNALPTLNDSLSEVFQVTCRPLHLLCDFCSGPTPSFRSALHFLLVQASFRQYFLNPPERGL